VTITTTGRPCDRVGESDVSYVGGTAFITPYDFHYVGERPCVDAQVYFEHTATLEFPAAGDAFVVLNARDQFAQELTRSDTVEVR
jgi:hypothetical protein